MCYSPFLTMFTWIWQIWMELFKRNASIVWLQFQIQIFRFHNILVYAWPILKSLNYPFERIHNWSRTYFRIPIYIHTYNVLMFSYHLAGSDGYFGKDCALQCYCRYEACIKATGLCPTKGCQRGWKGVMCSQGKLKMSTLFKITSPVEMTSTSLYQFFFVYLYPWFCYSFVVFPLNI